MAAPGDTPAYVLKLPKNVPEVEYVKAADLNAPVDRNRITALFVREAFRGDLAAGAPELSKTTGQYLGS